MRTLSRDPASIAHVLLHPHLQRPSGNGRDLTSRETEVARWLAQGKTNLEIGLILAISRRTVEKHVESILRKLGVENRVAAAVLISRAVPPGRSSRVTRVPPARPT